jgi:hypothetical protein
MWHARCVRTVVAPGVAGLEPGTALHSRMGQLFGGPSAILAPECTVGSAMGMSRRYVWLAAGTDAARRAPSATPKAQSEPVQVGDG